MDFILEEALPRLMLTWLYWLPMEAALPWLPLEAALPWLPLEAALPQLPLE